MRRIALVFALGTLAFIALVAASPIATRLEWSLFGLTLRLIEAMGLIGGGHSYWGQIDGVNIATHPYLLGIAVRTLATGIVLGPIMALLLWAAVRLRRSLAAERRSRSRVPAKIRAALALAVLCVVAGTFGQDIRNKLHYAALEHGDAWGCAMDWPWRMSLMHSDSRYTTSEHPWLCRLILDRTPNAVRVLLGVGGGLMLFALLGLWRWPDDGVLRCERCRYPIEGLDECPECGLGVTRTPA